MTDIGAKMKEIREARGEKQKALAVALGITSNTYSKYESGARCLPSDILRKFCLHYNISADYLLGICSEKVNVIKGSGAEKLLIHYVQLPDDDKIRVEERAEFLCEERSR